MPSPYWLEIEYEQLVVEASDGLRTAFTTWLREYGRVNGLPGLATGTLESRLRILRRIRHNDMVVMWTSPSRWAAGGALTMRFPELGIEMECTLSDSTLAAKQLALTPRDAPDPASEPGAVGAVISVSQIVFSNKSSAAVARELAQHFEQHAHGRWAGYIPALKAAVEAEIRDAQATHERILEQKQAMLRQLESPTGDLPDLVRLVAAPELSPSPEPVPSVTFINRAVGRNAAQAAAVCRALGLQPGQALAIVGPPGTGKSTTAAEIVAQLIRRDPELRVLVCSHSNHGTDNLLRRVLPFTQSLVRVGAEERVVPEARPYFTRSAEVLGQANVVFTTIDSLGLHAIAGAQLYDYVVVDEANRAGVLDSLLALARGKRMILVGDPMQLKPFVSESGQWAEEIARTSLFAWLMERGFPEAATVFLDEQNRMHPAIAALISRVFYAGRVRSGPAAPSEAASTTVFPSAVTWVDTSVLASREERRGTSLINAAEAHLAANIALHMLRATGVTVGVIAAYSAQRDLLQTLVDSEVEVDTVDAFEGREKDVVVVSLVRANERGAVGFLSVEQRLNVALSRARRNLIVVGNAHMLRGGYLDAVLSAVREHGILRTAIEVQAHLHSYASADADSR